MRLVLYKNSTNMAPEQLMRIAGYLYVSNRTGEDSFVRTFGRSPYPRFHIYLDADADKHIVNLHLDQKKPSYGSNHAHNAEYDGEVVEQEMERIKRFLISNH